jgi:hypothetical protein
MFVDNSLSFNGSWSTPQAITTTADGSSIIDITGAGSGNAPAMINGFPNLNTSIGEDYGNGDGLAVPYFYLAVTTAGTTANTLSISLKAAPDNGSYGQGTYETLYTSAPFAGTALLKGVGLIVPLPPIPNWASPTGIGAVLPRFYKVTYTCSAGLTVSVVSGLVLNPVSSLLGIQYPENFTVV